MKQIKIGTYPTFYGENNITSAFENGKIGFELDISDETHRNRTILTLENVLDLQKQIEASLIAYETFCKSWETQNVKVSD